MRKSWNSAKKSCNSAPSTCPRDLFMVGWVLSTSRGKCRMIKILPEASSRYIFGIFSVYLDKFYFKIKLWFNSDFNMFYIAAKNLLSTTHAGTQKHFSPRERYINICTELRNQDILTQYNFSAAFIQFHILSILIVFDVEHLCISNSIDLLVI